MIYDILFVGSVDRFMGQNYLKKQSSVIIYSSLYLADGNNVGVELHLQLTDRQFIAEGGEGFSVDRSPHLITDETAKKENNVKQKFC